MRLFVAIDFPEIVKDQLVQIQAALPSARWTKREQMHLTLRFVGDGIAAAKLPVLKAELSAVQAAAFDLQLAGVGRFPPNPKKPPRILWVGVRDATALLDLQRQVETAIQNAGFPAEPRPFAPHITLARLQSDRPLPEADSFLAERQAFASEPFRVTTFCLYSSNLSPQGARYTREAIVSLTRN